MRKKIHALLLLFSFWTQPVQAQKHDFMWPLGLGPGSEYNFFLDFGGNDAPNVVIRTDTFSMGRYSSSFCDKNGQIQFFSNGLKIFGRDGAVVENGEGLNPTLSLWQSQFSYPGWQSSFFLEKPNDQNIVYFVSLDWGLHPAHEFPYETVGQNLMVAIIDITANDGAGKVVEKNKILLSGILMSPTACRHANGRDWWIIVSDADENRHYRLLLTPEGFTSPETQLIGTKPNPIPYDGGNKNCQIVGNCFSPHGKYYADINDALGFSIFNFDRCTGMLSTERRVEYPSPLPTYPTWYRNDVGTGAVFSPNDSIFYKTTTFDPGLQPWAFAGRIPYLLQYDLSEPDITANVDTINTTDWSFPFNLTEEYFFGAELAPDGRIYVVHEGVSYCTVQYPNVRGRDCKFVHNNPIFGVSIGAAIPYMPNYRLGSLDGSPCDTLEINNIPVANFRVDDTLGLHSRYFYDLSYHEPSAWLWDFGDGNSSTEQSPIHQYDSANIYQVCLSVSNQFGSDNRCRTLYLGVSKTESPATKDQAEVSPNPFRDHLKVSLSANLCKPVFRLYDQMGRLLCKEVLKSGITEIETAHLQSGMYFWEIQTMGRTAQTGKCIKIGQ